MTTEPSGFHAALLRLKDGTNIGYAAIASRRTEQAAVQCVDEARRAALRGFVGHQGLVTHGSKYLRSSIFTVSYLEAAGGKYFAFWLAIRVSSALWQRASSQQYLHSLVHGSCSYGALRVLVGHGSCTLAASNYQQYIYSIFAGRCSSLLWTRARAPKEA